MDQRRTILKVLSPVENKHGKTFWVRIGSAFINRDGSTNVYLNAYPTNGKLQIRELDERDRNGGGHRDDSHRLTDADRIPLNGDKPFTAAAQDDLPF